jgi:hypothetical protein
VSKSREKRRIIRDKIGSSGQEPLPRRVEWNCGRAVIGELVRDCAPSSMFAVKGADLEVRRVELDMKRRRRRCALKVPRDEGSGGELRISL